MICVTDWKNDWVKKQLGFYEPEIPINRHNILTNQQIYASNEIIETASS